MDDLISRKAAIDALAQVGWGIKWDKALAEAIIKYLPSAQPSVSDCLGCNCPKMERLKEQKTFSEMVRLHDAETHCGAYMRGGEECTKAQ